MYIIVFSDYGTRWVEAFPLQDATAKSVARIFLEEIIYRHGAPRELLSDQGKQFTGKLMEQLTKDLNIHQQKTTAYHPQMD